jgi:hypothetical protein
MVNAGIGCGVYEYEYAPKEKHQSIISVWFLGFAEGGGLASPPEIVHEQLRFPRQLPSTQSN